MLMVGNIWDSKDYYLRINVLAKIVLPPSNCLANINLSGEYDKNLSVAVKMDAL